MILYWARGACSFAPHVVLEEIGRPFEARRIDPSVARPPEYLKLYPRGHVPLLVDGDFVLTEAHAIMVYLCDGAPQAGLIPPVGSPERARAHEFSGLLSSSVHIAYRQTMRPARFTDDPAAFEGIKKLGFPLFSRLMAEIDERLAGKTWVLGDRYSFVDPYLMIMARWAATAQLDMTALKNVVSHSRRMLERPAVQKVIQREELAPWP